MAGSDVDAIVVSKFLNSRIWHAGPSVAATLTRSPVLVLLVDGAQVLWDVDDVGYRPNLTPQTQ